MASGWRKPTGIGTTGRLPPDAVNRIWGIERSLGAKGVNGDSSVVGGRSQISCPKGIGDVASRLICTRHAAELCGFVEGSAMADWRNGLVSRSNAKRIVLEAAVAGMGRHVVGVVERDDADRTILL